ncbi:cytidylate kinase [Caldanaerobius fijiensis DSM 17918]|uniref:Cytidylate kinase n=1 Tax=Caldanaerobius fijiensis DSM 17918 TaxID=1121256 RepID=A0A1M4UE66_9THEO|nr:(d)CMP kinase [Caldanaerobius fijiensis]SHE54873.1 cytidylate kinase [Caldanaerobius fijiensis DSM 17918]
MTLYSIRGAISVEDNKKEDIINAAKMLINEIINSNNIDPSQIVDILFSVTKDLDDAYPAPAIRSLGYDIPVMCLQEAEVKHSLRRCIRVLVHIQADEHKKIKHVYLKKAKILRPDISNLKIAIDGPAGAGKSTVAKELAQRLNIEYIDTGAMYRAVTLKLLDKHVDFSDTDTVVDILNSTEIQFENGRIYLDNKDVTEDIRSALVTANVSKVASIPEVRRILVSLQRKIADCKSVVMEGRDIGTTVLKDADLKIFLTSSVEIRAKRRYEELKRKGVKIEFSEVIEQIKARDLQDETREYSPLKMADDAHLIDASNMSVDEVVCHIIELLK